MSPNVITPANNVLGVGQASPGFHRPVAVLCHITPLAQDAVWPQYRGSSPPGGSTWESHL